MTLPLAPRKRGPGRPKAIRFRDVARLAEIGAELNDILAFLGIGKALAAENAEKLRDTVERGHGVHRVRLSQRLEKEGVRRGKVTVLLAGARRHLGYDQALVEPADTMAGDAGEELLAAIERLRAQQLAAGTHVVCVCGGLIRVELQRQALAEP